MNIPKIVLYVALAWSVVVALALESWLSGVLAIAGLVCVELANKPKK